MNLVVAWQNPDEESNHKIQAVDYTPCSSKHNVVTYSTIDHFACNRDLLPTIMEAGVIHTGGHNSNHSAIYAKLQLGDIDCSTEASPRSLEKRVSWDKSTDQAKDLYRKTLGSRLDALEIPDCVMCMDVSCTEHSQDLEEYTLNILEAIESCSHENLALTGGSLPSSRKVLPGWSEYVKPFQDNSKFWHSLWMSANKPTTGPLADVMRQSKHQFKYA